MVRDQHKEIDTARYSHSAVLHRLGLGFHASTQATTKNRVPKGDREWRTDFEADLFSGAAQWQSPES